MSASRLKAPQMPTCFERSFFATHLNLDTLEVVMNNQLTLHVLREVIQKGVVEFCLAPGARNAPFVYALTRLPQVKIYYWPEERSAAFFALGRIKATGRPVAVVTTSGTAAAELLPAAMEAHYTGLPLLLLTADRPRRFRGTGAPQCAEQVGLFSYYAHYMQDLAGGDCCQLGNWSCEGPAHLNICLEEPLDSECQKICLEGALPIQARPIQASMRHKQNWKSVEDFLQVVHFPLVVVGALPPSHGEPLISFLLALGAPVYAEGISGIREDARLAPLRVTAIDRLWSLSEKHAYPIDGVLRIGGIPTARLWRDLENKHSRLRVCSVSEHSFSGLSWDDAVVHTSLPSFLEWATQLQIKRAYPYQEWLQADRLYQKALLHLFEEEPLAEPSLIYGLSKKIPVRSKVYLGNSLPIREWDLAATFEPRGYQVAANRGLNGIDGQLSTFLGYSSPEQDNWAILGDLTALYDMVAPWISSQIQAVCTNVVVVNNGGAQIFARLFAHEAFRNAHQLDFKPLADFWKWHYARWLAVPEEIEPSLGGRLIELIPDALATNRFVEKVQQL